jgi:hypothetical protein
VLWNMTEDDETKIDIFSVAPDGKFSKFDTDRLEFLPYANLDQLKVDPSKVQPRPGSKDYKAWLKAEEERKQREAEEKRLREGRDPNEVGGWALCSHLLMMSEKQGACLDPN